VALFVTLVTIFLMVVVSGTLVALATNEYQAAQAGQESRQAFQVTEAAIEKAMFELGRDGDWDDSSGATRFREPGKWYPLYDGSDSVVDAPFPSSSPLGRITVELRGASSSDADGCSAQACIWVRATGRVGKASRRIEVLLGKIFPGVDATAYTRSPVNIGAGGGGNGAFKLHGSLYIASCVDPDGGGPQPCIGLQMQGNGAILNDVPAYGDSDKSTDYHNRIYVRGAITGQGDSFRIGLESQPMMGVYASEGWAPSIDNQIHAYEKSNSVPWIPFPDPSALIADLKANKITRVNGASAYYCRSSACDPPSQVNQCNPNVWCRVNLDSSAEALQLRDGRKVVIPDAASGIDCTANPGMANRCNNATGAEVSGNNDFSLVFNGFGTPRTLDTQRDTYIHMQSRMEILDDLEYRGFTTFLIENESTGTTAPALLIRGSVNTTNFGQPGGNTYAFAVGPSNASVSGGDIYVRGSGIVLRAVLLSHGTLKNDNPQTWYGLFIANLLDWDNNPQIYRVEGLESNLPPGVEAILKKGFGVALRRWREIF
jgi:hypothetical protein